MRRFADHAQRHSHLLLFVVVCLFVGIVCLFVGIVGLFVCLLVLFVCLFVCLFVGIICWCCWLFVVCCLLDLIDMIGGDGANFMLRQGTDFSMLLDVHDGRRSGP